MTPTRLALQVRADLRARRWLRWHCSLIGGLTLLGAWATSHLLMRSGVDALAWRYGASFVVAYAMLLALMYLWARWLLSRDEGHADALQFDGGGSSGIADSPPADLSAIKSGGGGDFGGAGGGGSFDMPDLADGVAEGAAEATGSALEAVGAADEGAIILVPLALIVAVALALGTMLGFVVFGLFGVEVLLGVAVELAIASAAGALAYKAGAEGWLAATWRRTRWAAAITLLTVTALGASLDHWMPEARSLPHAVRLLRA